MKYLPVVLSLIVSSITVCNANASTGATSHRKEAAKLAINTDQYSACSLLSKDIYAYSLESVPAARQLESMSSPYGWTGTEVSLESLNVDDHVLKTAGTVQKDIQEPFSESWGTIAIPVCHDPYTPANQSGGTISITNGTKTVDISGIKYLGGYHTINGLGWRYINVQTLIDSGFQEGDRVSLIIKNSSSAPYSSYTGWGKLLKQAQGVPTIVLTFDDGGQGPWNQLQYSQDKGIKGTIFYPWLYEGRENKLSVAQLSDLKDAGWDIELNGTGDDSPMIFQETVDAAVEHLVSGRKWLAENGLNDKARFFAYPNGTYEERTNPIVKHDVTGDVGSVVIKMNNVSGIKKGMLAEGRTFPKGTRVVKVDAKKHAVILDHSSLGYGRGGESLSSPSSYMVFYDDSSEFFTGNLQAKLKREGFKIGRTTRPNTMYSRYCVGEYGLVAPARGSGISKGDDPVERIESWIEDPQKAGTTTLIYFHDITGSQDGINTSVDTYHMWLDKLAEARDEGKIQILTMSEWWERDCSGK